MLIPKRFKLDKAASAKPNLESGMHLDTIHILDGQLLASNGISAAYVPILGSTERPSLDFPRLELGEEAEDGTIPLQAIREATKGKTGRGTLRFGEHSTEAQSGHGKPWMRVEQEASNGQVPNFSAAKEMVESESPDGHRYVEVCLNAELLAGIASAIGAEEAVRLRFLVNEESGKADAAGNAHGVVDVRSIRNPELAHGVLMIHVVSE